MRFAFAILLALTVGALAAQPKPVHPAPARATNLVLTCTPPTVEGYQWTSSRGQVTNTTAPVVSVHTYQGEVWTVIATNHFKTNSNVLTIKF